jgi:hypothetical protein
MSRQQQAYLQRIKRLVRQYKTRLDQTHPDHIRMYTYQNLAIPIPYLDDETNEFRRSFTPIDFDEEYNSRYYSADLLFLSLVSNNELEQYLDYLNQSYNALRDYDLTSDDREKFQLRLLFLKVFKINIKRGYYKNRGFSQLNQAGIFYGGYQDRLQLTQQIRQQINREIRDDIHYQRITELINLYETKLNSTQQYDENFTTF